MIALANEDGGQQREDVCLQQGDEDFDDVNADGHEYDGESDIAPDHNHAQQRGPDPERCAAP